MFMNVLIAVVALLSVACVNEPEWHVTHTGTIVRIATDADPYLIAATQAAVERWNDTVGRDVFMVEPAPTPKQRCDEIVVVAGSTQDYDDSQAFWQSNDDNCGGLITVNETLLAIPNPIWDIDYEKLPQILEFMVEHELGHALGLEHDADTAAPCATVMCENYRLRWALKMPITAEQIAQAQAQVR